MFDFSFKTIFLPRFILDVYTMLYKPNPPAWNRRLIRRFGTDRESLFLYMCQKLLFPGKKVSLVISKKKRFSRTAWRRKTFNAVVIFIPKSEKRTSACFFNSESVFTFIVAVILRLCYIYKDNKLCIRWQVSIYLFTALFIVCQNQLILKKV